MAEPTTLRQDGTHAPDSHSTTNVGATIKAWRRYRGLTLTELAVRAGYSAKSGKSYLSRLEHGTRLSFRVSTLGRIAQALDIDPADLQQGRMPPALSAAVTAREHGQEDSQILLGQTSVHAPAQDLVHESLAALFQQVEKQVHESLAQMQTGLQAGLDQLIEQSMEHVNQRALQQREAHMLRRILRQAGHGSPVIETLGVKTETSYEVIEGLEECVRAGIQLMQSVEAPSNPQRNEILITWRGSSSPIEAMPDPYLRAQWVSACRAALERGWDIVFLVRIDTNPWKALAVVQHALALLGTKGNYWPRVLAPPEAGEEELAEQSDFIVVPPRGMLELRGLDMALYYPPNGRRFEVLEAKVRELWRTSKPLYRRFIRVSKERSEAITQFEEPGSDHYVFMDGLGQGSVPFGVHQERGKQLIAKLRKIKGRESDVERVDSTLRNRQTRELRFEAHLKKWRYRDILPRRALRRLVKEGFISPGNKDDMLAYLGAEILTQEQRLAVLKSLVERLQKYHNYELVLLEDAEADICRTFFVVKPPYGVLLEFWDLRPGSRVDDQVDHLTIVIDDRAAVRAFADNPLVRRYETLPPTNKQAVLAFLNEQITELEALTRT